MAAMNSNKARAHALRGEEVNFTEEARRIQSKALSGQASVVRLDQIVFFSTESGDAWMLDPEDGYAVCLARDFEPRHIPIKETSAKLAIEWNADYEIEGEAFTIVERDGSARSIMGYPVVEIQRVVREFPATPRDASSDADRARERLKSGPNDSCPCGSGKKYKKCCLARDEAVARQSTVPGKAWTGEPAEPVASIPGEASGAASDDTEVSDSAESHADITTELPSEEQRKADALWDEFEAWKRPTAEQMDAFLANLLELPPETTDWSDLFHRFARHDHPDLPTLFRRIVAAVPHTRETGMAFFYWAAAEEFVRRQYRHLLPGVAAGWRNLDLGSYDPDGLSHLEDYLLAEGFEAETLELAEHCLPILRADDRLIPHAVPELCGLIFELRVGRHLRSEPSSATTPDPMALELRRGIEEEIHPDAARNAADVSRGRSPVPIWAQSQFGLVSGDIRSDDEAWRQNLGLYGVLMHVAREAWQVEQRPPGCALRGLSLLLNSVYDWQVADRKSRKSASRNLLDYLRPDGLERRLIRACPELIGVNKPRVRLLLDAQGILLRFAARHQLVSDADAAESHKELARLQHGLGRLERGG
jgi:hypothetical protein